MALGVIPARIGSTRLPGKALAEIQGRPLVAWVVANALKARSLDAVIVATDDERIAAAARAAGAEVAMTDPDLPSGTDRVAAAIAEREGEIVVNVQGDEAELPAETIDAVVDLITARDDLDMATAAAPMIDREDFVSPNRVKVVLDDRDRALYFSRASIPYHRRDPGDTSTDVRALCHIGIYAFRRAVLMDLVQREPSELERLEKLEQLRALQAGYVIGVARVAEATTGIDTPADLEALIARLAARG